MLIEQPGAARDRAARDDARARVRLRTRLLNAYGAMLMIAFAAIVVGVYSILDIANVAAAQTARSRVTLAASDTMMLKLGDLAADWFDRAVSGRPPDPGRTARLTQAFRTALASARAEAAEPTEARLVGAIGREFEPLAATLERAELGSLDPTVPLLFERVRALSAQLASANMAALEATTQAARDRARKVSVLLLAVASVIALIVAWISTRVARSVTAPLAAIVDAAERIGAGEFGRRVPRSHVSELDRLATRFNLMAEALERLRALDVGKLVREQRRIETVLESIDDGLLILDRDGRVQRANGVALRQLGTPDAAVAGRTLDDVAPRLDLDEQAHAVLQSGEAESGELELGEGADERVVRWSLSPFHDGDQPGLVLVLRDVTDERAFEELRTQFVLRASHELRTPVTAVRMAFDLLAKRLPQSDPREAELVGTIHHELGRLAQLITDLLDLSKMYAQTLELRLEDVRAAELVTASAQRFRLRAEAAGVTLAVGPAPVDLVVRVDRPHVERVLDNLLSNALRHTPAGGRVSLELQRNGPCAEFAVADTGAGIPLALQARIFEPFTQFGEHAGGAGMGLALCREIVGRHGGRIWVRSAPGHGARFVFRLPVA
jgi:NtrC-family two-component system sensor histidine kinase KinB